MKKIIKKVLKIKIAAASVIALLIIALVIAGLIIFVPKSIKDTGLYYNDKGEAVTVSVNVRYHKGIKDSYYTGEVIVDGTTYRSVYDLYHTKNRLFVIENDYALTAFKNILSLTDFSDGDRTVRIITILKNGKSESYIGPAVDYGEIQSEFGTEAIESESTQENKKIYYIYDNNSPAVSYEFDTINLYEDREAECITKVVNPTETVEIEYTNYGSVISPFPKWITVNGNKLEYDLKYYDSHSYVKSYCMGFTYKDEHYNFLQKNGNISGIEKDGETIVYYSYGSDRFKDEVTGVFSKNECGDWVLNSDESFIGNINKIRGSFVTDEVHIYDDETGFYIDSYSPAGSSQSVYSYMTTEYGLPSEVEFTGGRYELVRRNETESGNDIAVQTVDAGTVYYSSDYFNELLLPEYDKLENEEYQAGEEKNNVQFSIIYDENLNEYTKGQIGVEYVSRFGLTYVYQFEDLCLLYNEKEIIINKDGQEYRLPYDLSNPDSPILPVYYIYRLENDKNGTMDIAIKTGEENSTLIDVSEMSIVKQPTE
ncbi:MAG TPA: hypothetical protein DCR91_03120 [Eubacterium sp.]|nr:hypothetical protein [Eubacterium sp.]HAZ86139.1 hypothetical protein [Eubacterium sp.]